jgi:hypothetical protein
MTALKNIRQESTPVKIKILTTLGQNKKTYNKETRHKKYKNICTLIST